MRLEDKIKEYNSLIGNYHLETFSKNPESTAKELTPLEIKLSNAFKEIIDEFEARKTQASNSPVRELGKADVVLFQQIQDSFPQELASKLHDQRSKIL